MSLWARLFCPTPAVQERERLQLALLGAHRQATREDALHLSEIRADLVAWENRGGQAAWISFVDHHRSLPRTA